MNEERFRRKPTIGLITLVFGVIFVYHGISYSNYNFIPPIVKFISAGLVFIYSIWQFATPYVIIDDTWIIVKKDIFKTRSIEISQIRNIEESDDEIELSNGVDTIYIKLKAMNSDDGKDLIARINEMKKE